MSANAASTASVPSPSCSPDGAPWYSPPVWCSCSGSKFATLAADSAAASVATRVTYECAKCGFSILLISTIKPVSVSPAPTNVPGMNGPGGCAAVDAGNEQGCPGVDYCNCNNVYAIVSNSASRDCDYSTQPTTNNCPINTAAVDSAFASAVAAAAGSGAIPCCNVIDAGCACSEGSTPEQDEDGRCCIAPNTHLSTLCSAETTGCPITDPAS